MCFWFVVQILRKDFLKSKHFVCLSFKKFCVKIISRALILHLEHFIPIFLLLFLCHKAAGKASVKVSVAQPSGTFGHTTAFCISWSDFEHPTCNVGTLFDAGFSLSRCSKLVYTKLFWCHLCLHTLFGASFSLENSHIARYAPLFQD